MLYLELQSLDLRFDLNFLEGELFKIGKNPFWMGLFGLLGSLDLLRDLAQFLGLNLQLFLKV